MSRANENEVRGRHSPDTVSSGSVRLDNSIDAVLNNTSIPANAVKLKSRGSRTSHSDRQECTLSNWDSYFSAKQASQSRKEGAILRHFRYKMVPWIEAGDPASQFGVDVMRLGQESAPVHAAILAVASLQLQLISDTNLERDNDMISYQREARSGLPTLHADTRRVGEALVALEALLSSSPSQWRNFPLFDLKQVSNDGAVSSVEEPLQTLYRLHARIGASGTALSQVVLNQSQNTNC